MTKPAVKQIEELVRQVTKEVSQRKYEDQLDALKILAPFYTLLKRAQIKTGDESDGVEPTMLEIKRRLELGKTIQQDYEENSEH